MDGARELVHATVIAIGGRAALIRGPSGSGKSDLALRCLALPVGLLVPEPVLLLSDDQVVLTRRGQTIEARAPDSIRGRIEVRGIGILPVPATETADLALVADLVAPGSYERLPERGNRAIFLGLGVPAVAIAPFEASAAIKLVLALGRAEPVAA